MGQCIGKRNYRYFLGFIVSVCLLCIYTAGWSVVVMLQHAHPSSHFAVVSFYEMAAQGASAFPASAAMAVFPLLVLLCVAPLTCYHCHLVCSNATTAEEIKEPYGPQNPFKRGWVENCDEACCLRDQGSLFEPRCFLAEADETYAADVPLQPVLEEGALGGGGESICSGLSAALESEGSLASSNLLMATPAL